MFTMSERAMRRAAFALFFFVAIPLQAADIHRAPASRRERHRLLLN